jgi:hypothetical protein
MWMYCGYDRSGQPPVPVTVNKMTIAFDAPSRPDAGTDRSLRIAHVARGVFPGTSEAALDPDLRVYLGDLVRPYDLALREDLLISGAGQSYGEMCAELIRAAVPAAAPVDLLVLAFASPDIRPGRATASYLSGVCPGTPMGFAVTDQGAATAFTALRLIHQYAQTGACRRALLLVAEQATLHYEAPPGLMPTLPERHAAIAIRFDVDAAGAAAAAGAGDGRCVGQVRVHAGVAPDEVAALLAADRTPGATVIAGHGLPDSVAPPGQPFTGVWWGLAERGGLGWVSRDAGGGVSGDAVGRVSGDAGGDLLLADYDARLRYLATASVTAAR